MLQKEGNTMPKDKISWIAIYNDGSKLPKYRDDGSENKYEDIDRKRLTQFILLDYDRPVIIVHLDPKKRLINKSITCREIKQ